MTNKYDSGAFIPTTSLMDVSEVYSTEVTSPEFKELIVRLYQNFNNLSLAINSKDTGIYAKEEFVTGQTFFPNPSLDSSSDTTATERPIFRKVIDLEGLPAASKVVTHGITIDANTIITRIYGAASDQTAKSFIPLPYAHPTNLAWSISMNADSTNVYVTVGIDRTSYTKAYVILEYIKT